MGHQMSLLSNDSERAISPLRPGTSLRQAVTERLSAAIISGEIPPLELVSVPSLASRFQISATPVREAMLDLEKRGFVESVRNRGFRVTEMSFEDLQQIVQIRRWLECPAMGIVAAAYPNADHEPFRALAHNIVRTAQQSDFTGFLAADSEFHLKLLTLTENDRLVQLVAELRAQTRLVGLAQLANTVELAKTAAEHYELLDLLASGEGLGAERLMHTHIGHVVGWWAGRPEPGGARTEAGRRERVRHNL